MFRTRLRPEELAAIDRLCRQRGWSHADAVRSMIDPPRGHERINPKVNGLTYMLPERYALAAVEALQDAIRDSDKRIDLMRAVQPTEAMAWRTARGEMEEAMRFFGGVVRDYGRLHDAKDHAASEGTVDDTHKDEGRNPATDPANAPSRSSKR